MPRPSAPSPGVRFPLFLCLFPLFLLLPSPSVCALPPGLAAGRSSRGEAGWIFLPSRCCRKSFSPSSESGAGASRPPGGRGPPGEVFLARQPGGGRRGRLRAAPHRRRGQAAGAGSALGRGGGFTGWAQRHPRHPHPPLPCPSDPLQLPNSSAPPAPPIRLGIRPGWAAAGVPG